MKKISKFIQLPNSEKVILYFLILNTVKAEIILKFFSYRYKRNYIFKNSSINDESCSDEDILFRHIYLHKAVIQILPWQPTCLRNAIALRNTLNKSGISAELKIGVRSDNETIAAHAWLLCLGHEIYKKKNYSELNL